jgi:hypothetical protein
MENEMETAYGWFRVLLRTTSLVLCNETYGRSCPRTDGDADLQHEKARAVLYPIFAQISALCRARKSTNPTIHRPSLHCIAALCMVGLADLLARHGANI